MADRKATATGARDTSAAAPVAAPAVEGSDETAFRTEQARALAEATARGLNESLLAAESLPSSETGGNQR